jgi:BioD-like phosphotransacetylase family protein
MPTILIASLQSAEGRTAAAAGLGACLAEQGQAVRLARIRAAEGADAPAEDDARALAGVPGCASSGRAITDQEAQAQAKEAQGAGALLLIETQPGAPDGLAARLGARVVIVSSAPDDLRLGDLAAAAGSLGRSLLGVVLTRQPERRLAAARSILQQRGVRCLAALPEDRLLAGPSVRELAEALHASRLVEGEREDEALEYVMLGPISADPGQPYFLQHGSKAVINRFDKMDLHLAALATEPDCLILTGGQPPSPYLLDRVAGGDSGVTVLLSPEGTVRTVELVDELYGRTRFSGQRKIARAVELFRSQFDRSEFEAALG